VRGALLEDIPDCLHGNKLGALLWPLFLRRRPKFRGVSAGEHVCVWGGLHAHVWTLMYLCVLGGLCVQLYQKLLGPLGVMDVGITVPARAESVCACGDKSGYADLCNLVAL
jgi:hypothetical protein